MVVVVTLHKVIRAGKLSFGGLTSRMSLMPQPQLRVAGPPVEGDREVLTSEALDFLAALEHRFAEARADLLAARMRRRDAFRAGELPDFLAETRGVREGSWQVAPAPADLLNRRVEITGPVERKMMINALNSGRAGLHGRLRGCPLADVGERDRRPAELSGGSARANQLHLTRREALRLGPASGNAGGPSPRVAPERETPAAGRTSGFCESR